MVVWRASPLRNEAPKAGGCDPSVVAAAGVDAEAGEETSAETGTGDAGVGPTGLTGFDGVSGTGGAVFVLVEGAGVGLGWRWVRSIAN